MSIKILFAAPFLRGRITKEGEAISRQTTSQTHTHTHTHTHRLSLSLSPSYILIYREEERKRERERDGVLLIETFHEGKLSFWFLNLEKEGREVLS